MNKDLKIGCRIYLAANCDLEYNSINPRTCAGTVRTIDHAHLVVLWDNGLRNCYTIDNPSLITKVQPSRDIARVAARRNPNLTVKRVDGEWVLVLKDKLVINDGGKR